jgi:hypothetical protein
LVSRASGNSTSLRNPDWLHWDQSWCSSSFQFLGSSSFTLDTSFHCGTQRKNPPDETVVEPKESFHMSLRIEEGALQIVLGWLLGSGILRNGHRSSRMGEWIGELLQPTIDFGESGLQDDHQSSDLSVHLLGLRVIAAILEQLHKPVEHRANLTQ